MNSVRSNSLSLKYQRFTASSCKDYGLENLVCGKDSIHFLEEIINRLTMKLKLNLSLCEIEGKERN